MEKIKFSELHISEEILKAVENMGFEYTTPIQEQAIPVIAEGRDIVGLAQTGTGKTAAFGIPSLDKVEKNVKGIQLMVLCPTRELALQVAEELKKLSEFKKNIKIVSIYGGDSMGRQLSDLKRGVNVVIGTPGRVMDHMRRGTLKLENLKTLILDEADEMLNMGFREDIEVILQSIDHDIQKLLFSATMKKNIMEIVKEYLKDPVKVKIEAKELTTPNITQKYICVKEDDKGEAICRIIDFENPRVSLVFCNTKRKVDELYDVLESRGYDCEKIHGDMRQSARNLVISKVKAGKIKILIATDVAARGLDIEEVDMVFNYDVPTHEEYYVHRIGRTGRAGRQGTSVSLVTKREMRTIKDIMRFTKKDMEQAKLPSIKQLQQAKICEYMDSIKNNINEESKNKYLSHVNKLIEETGCTAEDILCSLIDTQLSLQEYKDIETQSLSSSERSSTRSRREDSSQDRESRSGRRTQGKTPEKGMKRFFVNVGKDKDIKVEEILKLIVTNTNITGKDVGIIDMYDKFTFVEVKDKYMEEVLKKSSNNKIKGKKVNIELAGKRKN
ncbi:ATP-dependent RNA helicase DeaD [Hathewaya proteolytica DSM 3090]|uniref:ATP-dependent RNA helicase CshA n=1 Tax=Hathewaya proteolytica DSM 3090 TaxID=1121331 RepID=A0A1M6R935_9CLOT|nr:DEAD/DEAH box helicase [Hathewaya proteolytica]SHK28985.1 ATP-dependent RNA helicase DeaD [Hathewaya proteolytica DSM 3090]